MEYEIQLFDAIESSRLKLVNDIRIDELSPNQQSKLLMVKYGVDILEEIEAYSYLDKSAFCDITLLEVVQDDATIPIKRRNVTITLFIFLLFRFNV